MVLARGSAVLRWRRLCDSWGASRTHVAVQSTGHHGKAIPHSPRWRGSLQFLFALVSFPHDSAGLASPVDDLLGLRALRRGVNAAMDMLTYSTWSPEVLRAAASTRLRQLSPCHAPQLCLRKFGVCSRPQGDSHNAHGHNAGPMASSVAVHGDPPSSRRRSFGMAGRCARADVRAFPCPRFATDRHGPSPADAF